MNLINFENHKHKNKIGKILEINRQNQNKLWENWEKIVEKRIAKKV